jgi:magnesium transporter
LAGIRLTQRLSVNPLYYVTFTTFTLLASFILFRGFNTTDAVNTISLLAGFLTIFTGVYLLNLSREDPDGNNLGINSDANARGKYAEVDGIPTDGLGAIQTRMSMSRRSEETHRRSNSWSLRSPITGRFEGDRVRFGSGDQQHLMHSYDVDANGLGDLTEDSDEDSAMKRTSFENGNGEGRSTNGTFGAPRRVQSASVAAGGKSFDQLPR